MPREENIELINGCCARGPTIRAVDCSWFPRKCILSDICIFGDIIVDLVIEIGLVLVNYVWMVLLALSLFAICSGFYLNFPLLKGV